jgi:uncharacterized repeat protein (TIGR04138 family)
MAQTGTIANNLPCRSCAYNLRGLQFDGVCPECGELIADSFQSATAQMAKLLDEDPANMARRIKSQALADKVGCTVDALTFVLDAVRQASSWKAKKEYDAKFVCMAVRIYAVRYFNNEEEARDLLASWGLTSGDQIGKIIYGLVEQGFLRKQEGDSIDQFSGLFDLKHIFPGEP